jgi:alcohol dehydrogenase (cytochrome c)
MRNKTILLLGAAVALGALGATALGQGASGPFTQAQVGAGRQAFEDNCAACHLQDLSGTNDAPALAGTPFMGAWGKRTTAQLYSKIATTMPLGQRRQPERKTIYRHRRLYPQAQRRARRQRAFTPTTSGADRSVANGRATRRRSAHGGAASGRQEPPARPCGTEQFCPRHGGPARARSRRLRPADTVRLTLEGNIQNYVPVTEAMMRNPPDSDWLMFRRNYQGWSYSPLKQITAQNVGSLQLKWMWSMPENGTMEITPIVHNGVMYVWGTGNTVQALNAGTGELLWENRLGPAPRRPGPGPSTEETRSLGLWGNNVYVNTPYGYLYAPGCAHRQGSVEDPHHR